MGDAALATFAALFVLPFVCWFVDLRFDKQTNNQGGEYLAPIDLQLVGPQHGMVDARH